MIPIEPGSTKQEVLSQKHLAPFRKKVIFFVAGLSKSRFQGKGGFKSFGAKAGYGTYGQGYGGRGYQTGYQSNRGAFTRYKPNKGGGGKCPAPTKTGIHSDPFKNPISARATVPEPRCESDGKNFTYRKLVGRHPPSQKTTTKFELVVKKCNPRGGQVTKGRHKTSLVNTPQNDFESSSKGGGKI